MADPALLSAAVAGTAAALSSAIAAYRQLRGVRQDVNALGVTLSHAGSARGDAVICDYVDAGTLRTLARQYHVSQSPDELQHTVEGRDKSGLEVGGKGAKAQLGREDTSSLRALYRVEFDPHVLTGDVLSVVESNGLLRTDLADSPTLGLPDIERGVQEHPNKPLKEVWNGMIERAKRLDFEGAWKRNDYILIESDWRVLNPTDQSVITLSLTKLGSEDTVVEMPSNLALNATIVYRPGTELPDSLITPQGLQRFVDGSVIRASVFGRAGRYDALTGSLSINPIAVFTRAPGTNTRIGSAGGRTTPGGEVYA